MSTFFRYLSSNVTRARGAYIVASTVGGTAAGIPFFSAFSSKSEPAVAANEESGSVNNKNVYVC